jgi:hypothetical protein
MSVFLEVPFQRTCLQGARVYVVELADGTVKVGRSRAIDQRFRSYSQSRPRPQRAWISDEVTAPTVVECTVIADVTREATARRGNEYFTGVTLERVVAITEAAISRVDAESNMSRAIGQRVLERLTEIGWSVEAASEVAGFSRVGLYRRIRGDHSWTDDELFRIADALGVTLGDLYVEERAA